MHAAPLDRPPPHGVLASSRSNVRPCSAMPRLRTSWRALAFLPLALVGCPKALDKTRPDAPTASQALDPETEKACGAEAKLEYGKPLVVDMPSADRGDLEVAMRDGLVLVHYDCKTLQVLPDCHVDGSYGFAGFSPKEEVVRLASQDELNANLPISAGPVGAKLGGELSRGTTLDIALMTVGKRRTTRKATTRADLVSDRPGACAKATHFVRGAFVGAFAMTTGSKSEARGAAEIFGIPQLGKVGVGNSGSSSKDVESKDGSVDACRGASADAESAPGGCEALVRLELVMVDESPEAAATEADADVAPYACGAGLVETGGKCARPTENVTHLCKPDDIPDCEKQCEAGDPGSCSRMGYYHQIGKGTSKDLAQAASLYKKACDGGFTVGCASLGALYVLGEGVKKDTEKGIGLVQKACEAGDTRYCAFLGQVLYTGNLVPKDPNRAARFLRLACNGGASDGCFLYGELYRKGIAGLSKDAVKARAYYRKGCEGGDRLGCYALAVAYEDGIGGPKDAAAAQSLFHQLCDAGLKEACAAAK